MSHACPIAAVRDLTATAAELNLLDGVSGLVQADLTKLAAIEASAAEIADAADKSVFAATYTVTAPAAIPSTVRVIELNHASTAIEKTIATLVPYANSFLVIKDISASGTAAHTVTVTTGTLNGTNKIATLDAPGEALVIWVDSAGNGIVVVNTGEVALSGT
ncbi:MAG: hypothetical protein JXP37_07655 [Coriobacteriia bacterium]|nr:hypothetical protein [Coriobacteriia bacterium]